MSPEAKKAAKKTQPSKKGAERIGLHSLSPAEGSRRTRKRLGRGKGSGFGKTSGRGHKGAGARAGAKRKVAYEGGQTPLHMRMGKLRGPHHKMSMPSENFRTATQPVNVATLEDRFSAGDEVTPEALRAKGLATRRDPVKILGSGELSTKLTVRAHAFSATAKQKIEAAGGTAEALEGPNGASAAQTPASQPADPGSEAEESADDPGSEAEEAAE